MQLKMMRALQTSVACLAGLAALSAAAADKEPAGIVVDKDKGTVTIPAKIAPRKIDDPAYKGIIYPIEVVACWAYPKGKKAHETVVTVEVKPSEVHKALEGLGLKAGKPAAAEKVNPEGPEVNMYLEIPAGEGETKRVPIEKTLIDPRTNKPLGKLKWRFTGSAMVQPNPDKDEKVYGADESGTLIAIFPVTNLTVFQTNLLLEDEKFVKLETDKKLLPKEGTPVKLIIEVPPK
jgi:hypothetical protein